MNIVYFSKSLPVLIRWLFGLMVACAIVWCIALYCSTTLYNWEWDAAIGDYVISAGTIHQHRTEGWGRTLVGRHGIYAIPDVSAVKEPKVVFWGDSFVQGFQVDDDDKMAQQFTTQWNDKHTLKLRGLGIGTGERDCADYYFLMPKYQETLKPIHCHVIVIHDLADTLPDRSTTRFRFASKPDFHFEIDDPIPPIKNPGLITLARYFRADAFFRFASSTKNKIKHLRFRLGPIEQVVEQEQAPMKEDAQFYRDAWDYLLTGLTAQTDQPILIVYSPAVPSIDKGKVILTDPNAAMFKEFKRICNKHGAGVIDLTPDLIALYESSMKLSRGFSNTTPLEGHFNKEGHRLIAEAVCMHLEKAQNAIHSN